MSFRSEVKRTDAPLTNRIGGDIELLSEIECFGAVDDIKNWFIPNISEWRMEEAGSDGAVGLDDRRDPRSVALGRHRRYLTEVGSKMEHNTP